MSLPSISQKPIKVLRPVIPEARAYWLMQFAAVLECVHNHKQLFMAPRTKLDETWSLIRLRGFLPLGAFQTMMGHVTNWGAQYLFTYVFNENTEIRNFLMAEIASLENCEFIESKCYVSGRDSIKGEKFLRQCKARLASDLRRRVHKSREPLHLDHTDLCILARLSDRPDPIAFFGEVEANKGHLLLRSSFWQAKSTAATFGVGFKDGVGEAYSIQVVDTTVGPRVVLLMGTNRSVFGDFHLAVELVDALLQRGVHGSTWWNQLSEPGLSDVLGFIRSHWETPVILLLPIMQQEFTSEVPSFETQVGIVEDTGFTDAPKSLVVPGLLIR